MVEYYYYLTPSFPVILESVTVICYREIPHILLSSNIHDLIHKMSFVPILNSVKLVIFLLLYLFEIHFNNMLPLNIYVFQTVYFVESFRTNFYNFYLVLCVLMPS